MIRIVLQDKDGKYHRVPIACERYSQAVRHAALYLDNAPLFFKAAILHEINDKRKTARNKQLA